MNRTGKNQHEWGVVAQERDPYEEYHWCQCCRKFKDCSTDKLYTKTQFRQFIQGRTLFVADSDIPFDIEGY